MKKLFAFLALCGTIGFVAGGVHLAGKLQLPVDLPRLAEADLMFVTIPAAIFLFFTTILCLWVLFESPNKDSVTEPIHKTIAEPTVLSPQPPSGIHAECRPALGRDSLIIQQRA